MLLSWGVQVICKFPKDADRILTQITLWLPNFLIFNAQGAHKECTLNTWTTQTGHLQRPKDYGGVEKKKNPYDMPASHRLHPYLPVFYIATTWCPQHKNNVHELSFFSIGDRLAYSLHHYMWATCMPRISSPIFASTQPVCSHEGSCDKGLSEVSFFLVENCWYCLNKKKFQLYNTSTENKWTLMA